jgi:hypothetical protein
VSTHGATNNAGSKFRHTPPSIGGLPHDPSTRLVRAPTRSDVPTPADGCRGASRTRDAPMLSRRIRPNACGRHHAAQAGRTVVASRAGHDRWGMQRRADPCGIVHDARRPSRARRSPPRSSGPSTCRASASAPHPGSPVAHLDDGRVAMPSGPSPRLPPAWGSTPIAIATMAPLGATRTS